jgi:hypothetical protein
MSSVRDRFFSFKRKGWLPGSRPSRGRVRLPSWFSLERLLLGRRAGFRRRISIQVWLTVLFLLVIAFAGGTAYSIVYPRLENTLMQMQKDSFEQVFDQFEENLRRNPRIDEQYISFYAINRGLEWGVIQENGEVLRGDPGEYDASRADRPRKRNAYHAAQRAESEDREGQTLANLRHPDNDGR